MHEDGLERGRGDYAQKLDDILVFRVPGLEPYPFIPDRGGRREAALVLVESAKRKHGLDGAGTRPERMPAFQMREPLRGGVCRAEKIRRHFIESWEPRQVLDRLGPSRRPPRF